ncbi:MAG: hypothetical protein E6I52_23440 [Chloroflexi bacterium]|nr:MAG: hypothetical protein E6I52_23440 [Chloroflexota bacterium]
MVTAPEVASSIERHLGNPRPVALSRAALAVLAIVAYRQPIACAGIELISCTLAGPRIGQRLGTRRSSARRGRHRHGSGRARPRALPSS